MLTENRNNQIENKNSEKNNAKEKFGKQKLESKVMK